VKWECEIKDGEGNMVSEVNGEYEMPEISSDMENDGEEWEIRTSFGKGSNV
jgi:hypothetical protein